MRHLITLALLASVLLLASSTGSAHPHTMMMEKECWENKPTAKPVDCCRGLTMLPEQALAECTKLYPEEEEEEDVNVLENTTRNRDDDDDDDDDDNDDDDDDQKKRPDKHHHHHHRHHHHGKHPCVVECYFNKTGVYKDLQVVKTTALKLFSDNTDSAGTFQALLSSSIDTCIAEQETMEKKFKEMMTNGDHPHPHHHPHSRDGKHCPPKAFFFTKCVEMNAFKNCPADRKVSNSECQKLTEFIDKCVPKVHN